MKAFVPFFILATSSALIASCSRTPNEKQSLTIGMDEDYKIQAYYDGSGWGHVSKSLTTFTDLDGLTKLTFLADRDWSLMSTQHYTIRIVGTSKPIDTNWDYFAWDLRVSSKEPLELVFSGFQNTNGYKTNEDGTVFDCKVGENSIVFTGQLVSVYDRETNRWHK
jgi:hypothetical protein